MKKKVVAALLAMCMVAGALTGCGNGNQSQSSDNSSVANASAQEDSATVDEQENADAAEDTTATTEDEAASGEPVTIRFAWWGGQERADKTNAAVELFMEQNPDIKVETSFFPFESYYENITIAATAGNMPDVFQGFVGANNDLMEAGLVEPLDSYVESGLIDLSNVSAGLTESAKIDGKTYGVALGCNVKCMIVDPEAYEVAGLTIPEVAYESWDALAEDLQKLKDSGLKYGADDVFERGFALDYFCRQRGETSFSSTQESTIGFSEDTYVDYYNYKLDWIEKGLIPPYDVTKESMGPEDSQTAKGNAAVRHCYSSQYAQIADAAGKEMKLILMPGPDTDKGTDIRPGVHACMASTSEHKEAAAKLIDFLLNDIEGNKILNADRGMPASSVVREALIENFDENQKKMAEALSLAEEHSSASSPMPKGDTTMIDATNSGMLEDLEQEMVYGQLTPQEAYEQLAAEYGPK